MRHQLLLLVMLGVFFEVRGKHTCGVHVKHSFRTAYAVITIIAIRLRHDYDPTTTYRARLLPFDAIRREQK